MGNPPPVPALPISLPPDEPRFVRFAEDFGRRFIVTVDTEEEFDWNAPIDRTSHTLYSVGALSKFQQFCEGHGVVPAYLLDYPVATSPAVAEALGAAVAEGRAEVGVQLHPWVSPPIEEAMTAHNTYAGNLPEPLERAKFETLARTIESVFGTAPVSYRAGRYGVGANSAAILADNGIAIDTSVRANFDYSHQGGPNFRNHPLRPYWIDRDAGLMELPLTTVYSGPFRALGPAIYPLFWRVPAMRGVLSRLGALERIPLTPEGVTAREARRGIDAALAADLPILVFSFHSPSLEPGHTPYVRTSSDLDAFYDWWREILAHLERCGVRPASLGDVARAAALASHDGAG